MAYNPLNEDKPAGEDTPPVYADTDLVNVRALRDGIVSGFLPGWAFAFSSAGGPPRDIYTWSRGVFRLRATLTYTAGLISSLLWEWSDNSGGAYVVINTGGTASALVSSANGNISSVDKDATAFLIGVAAGQRAGVGAGNLNAHIAAVGAAVHGLGTIATQNANAVNITGGGVANLFGYGFKRITHEAPPVLASGVAWDWSAKPTMCSMNAGGTINGITNAAAGEMKRLLVTNSGPITIVPGAGVTLMWGVGHPVWGTNNTMLNFIAQAATVILATSIPF